MVHILPVASGKGGVGKTVFSANLGASLAKQGKTVILIDLDLGGANLHTCLGVRNRHAGLGGYINRKESSLESLIVETDVRRLYFIPGDSLLPGTANLGFFIKKKILAEIPKLVADFVILDLGSGTAYNTVDFYLCSASGIIVTTPETTAVLNAYSFLKTSLFRLLTRTFPARSAERELISRFVSEKIEGTDHTFEALAAQLGQLAPDSGRTALQQIRSFYPRIILNRARSDRDIPLGAKLRQIVKRNLSTEVEYIGILKDDELVSRSLLKRVPAYQLEPNSSFALNMDRIAQRLIAAPVPRELRLYEADEDLSELASSGRT